MIICALFLFIKYIAQLFPSLIGSELMKNYSLTALNLGILASSYYYSYSTMQIFSGWMLDRFSIRYVATVAIGILGLSLFVFAEYHSYFMMCFSRILMGAGASFATVLYMKCAAIWTSRKTFGLVASFLATATMLGAAFGGAPLAYLFHAMSWQSGLFLMGAISIAIAILTFVIVSDVRSNDAMLIEKNKIKFSELKTVFMNRKNLLLMAYSGLAFSPVVIMGGLWGTPFLILKYHLSTVQVSYLLSIMFMGIAMGAPIWSAIALYFKNLHLLMQLANLFSFISICCIIYGFFSYPIEAFLFFMLGFSVGCFMFSFQICRDINPIHLLGFAFAFMNTGEGVIGSVVEPAIGGILDITKGHAAVFTLANFHEALILLPCCFVFASILLAKLNVNASEKLYDTECAVKISPA